VDNDAAIQNVPRNRTHPKGDHVMYKKELIETIAEAIAEHGEVRLVMTYEEAGMITSDTGLVVRTIDGSEFQITIVKSR
jgi:hypothetical protein